MFRQSKKLKDGMKKSNSSLHTCICLSQKALSTIIEAIFTMLHEKHIHAITAYL